MICRDCRDARALRVEMTVSPNGERHCPKCKRVGPWLHDMGLPLPVPALTLPAPVEPSVEERGWVQALDPVVMDVEETPREKAQRERREREKAEKFGVRALVQAHAAALREDTRRVNAATRARAMRSVVAHAAAAKRKQVAA